VSQTCTICKHPLRLQIEQAPVASIPRRTIEERFGLAGPSTGLLRQRSTVAGVIAKQTQACKSFPTGTLLQNTRVGEGRAERLYAHAAEIPASALKNKDRRTALIAIRSAVDVMGQARRYLEPPLASSAESAARPVTDPLTFPSAIEAATANIRAPAGPGVRGGPMPWGLHPDLCPALFLQPGLRYADPTVNLRLCRRNAQVEPAGGHAFNFESRSVNSKYR
jgi:hypothetical protein